MVQAGSNLKPDASLTEARRDVARAKLALKEAQQLHEEAERALEAELARQGEAITKEELLESVVKELDAKKRVDHEEEHVKESVSTFRKVLKNLQSGGMAGVVARSCVAPIDRVKILQQTAAAMADGQANEYAGKNIAQVTRMIVQKEGVKGLWRGNFTNCVRVFPHAATQFTAYDFFKSQLPKITDSPDSYIAKVACGGLAGATAVTVTHPMDLVRIRLQTQQELKGVGDAVSQILKKNGPTGFYRGYTSAVLSLSPFIAVNFTTFDIIKSLYFGPQAGLTKQQIKQQNPLLNLVFGALSGLVASTVCYPLDTVRRRMAVAGATYTGNIDAVRTILRTEGPLGFYNGMAANALKVAPNNAIRFAAFEFIRNYVLS